jgi:hypothetical protein
MALGIFHFPSLSIAGGNIIILEKNLADSNNIIFNFGS